MTITTTTTTTTTSTVPALSGCGTPGCGAVDVPASGCPTRRVLCDTCQIGQAGACDVGDLTDLYWLDDHDTDPAATGGGMYDGARICLSSSLRLSPAELATAAWMSNALTGGVELAEASDELVRYEVAFTLTFCGLGGVRDQLDQVRNGLPFLDPTRSLAENVADTALRIAHWAACSVRVRQAFGLDADTAVSR
jgi:hypothetical protein